MSYSEQERRTSPTTRAKVVGKDRGEPAVDKNDAEQWLYQYETSEIDKGTKKPKWVKSKDPNRRGIKVRVGAKEFYVDVPKSFFNEDGHFVAFPEYKTGEELHIKYTGYGKNFGFIDTNVIERGAGGGDRGDLECAKWS